MTNKHIGEFWGGLNDSAVAEAYERFSIKVGKGEVNRCFQRIVQSQGLTPIIHNQNLSNGKHIYIDLAYLKSKPAN